MITDHDPPKSERRRKPPAVVGVLRSSSDSEMAKEARRGKPSGDAMGRKDGERTAEGIDAVAKRMDERASSEVQLFWGIECNCGRASGRRAQSAREIGTAKG